MIFKSVRHLAATFILLQASSLGTVAQLPNSVNHSKITGFGVARFGMTKQQLEAALKNKLTLHRGGAWAIPVRQIKKYNPSNYITVRATQDDIKYLPQLVFTRKDKVKVKYLHNDYLLRNVALGEYRYNFQYGFMGKGDRLDRIFLSYEGGEARAACSNLRNIYVKFYGAPTKIKNSDNLSEVEWENNKEKAGITCVYSYNSVRADLSREEDRTVGVI